MAIRPSKEYERLKGIPANLKSDQELEVEQKYIREELKAVNKYLTRIVEKELKTRQTEVKKQ